MSSVICGIYLGIISATCAEFTKQVGRAALSRTFHLSCLDTMCCVQQGHTCNCSSLHLNHKDSKLDHIAEPQEGTLCT